MCASSVRTDLRDTVRDNREAETDKDRQANIQRQTYTYTETEINETERYISMSDDALGRRQTEGLPFPYTTFPIETD